MKKVFYIIGDSWLSHYTAEAICSDTDLFRDWLVINHSVPGANNLDIIRRLRVAINHMQRLDLQPAFCVGLSEVGRGLLDEFRSSPPQANLTRFLSDILYLQANMLIKELASYPSYICTGWVTNPFGTKSIIDFLQEDFSDLQPCYTVSNGIYQWLSDRLPVFKFDQQSFIDAVDNRNQFQSRLLKNPFVDNTLHLDPSSSKHVYHKFFAHVLDQLEV